MKTFYLAVCLAITMIGPHYRTAAQIDKEHAIEIIKSNLTNEELQNYNVLIFPDMIQGQDFSLSPYHVLYSKFDISWLFFIDMYPLAQWDHDCKYIFVDQQTGDFTAINFRIPPQDYWYGWEYVNSPYPYPVNYPLEGSNLGESNMASADPHKYAVFLCWKEWEPCRWNNLSHLYCGIKRNYGFMDENIFVLSGNGTYDSVPTYNLDNDTILNDFDGPCIYDSIEDVFSYLSQTLTNEDLLFIYATSHGEKRGQDTSFLRLWNYDSLFDYELAEMLDDIQCSEKILGLDACYSGGFKENFEDSHTVLQTCVSADTISIIYNGFGFQDMSFWWGTALRGYYPYSKAYPYVNGPKIGEHDSLFTISNIDSVDFNPDDTLGGNKDGFIQFQEAFNFASRYASDIRDRGGQNYINEGFQGDLLTLNGIEGRVDTSQEISGNFLIGRKLTLAPGVVLSDLSNMQNPLNFFLNDSTEILVQDSATLNIDGYYTKFIGCSGESFLKIEGDVSDEDMNFEANPFANINVNFNNPGKSYALDNYYFENAGIQASCNQLKFTLADFNNTLIDFSGSRLELNHSNLFSGSDLEFSGTTLKITNLTEIENSGLNLYSGTDTINELTDITNADIFFSGDELYILGDNNLTNCTLDLSNGNINIENGNDFINSSIAISQPINSAGFIEILNNSFDNDTSVVANATLTIEDFHNFQVDSNNFSYASGRGIELFYAGWNGRGLQQIMGNTIELDQPSTSLWTDVGIHSYCSKADIRNNRIRNNSYGIVGFHESDLKVLGDSTAYEYSETQFIADNTRTQCLFNIASFPTEFHWNVIRDTIQYSSQYHPFIKTVDYDELMQDTTEVTEERDENEFDVTYNCWVNESDPTERLFPVGDYVWRESWCPPGGEGQQKSDDIAQSIYYQAYNDISDSNYAKAESEFRQVILEFSESKYAIASLKGLYALNPALYNTNYSVLKTYCDSLALNPGDSLLGKTAEWFSIRCNIKDHNYQQAVNSLDSILSNPGTYADSIFALIDLSEVFAEISDTSALKSSLATRNPQVIPSSYKQHLVHRKEWVDLLLKPAESKYPGKITPPDKIDSSICKINSIHPNPAQTTFTVDYSIFHTGNYKIIIISSSGQVVTTLDKGILKPGNHVDIQNCNLMKAGIYLLAITCNDVIIESNKLMVVK